jgi:hypothetical protein
MFIIIIIRVSPASYPLANRNKRVPKTASKSTCKFIAIFVALSENHVLEKNKSPASENVTI